MEPHTVLVTGGRGYLGSVLVDRLDKQGFEVIALDNGLMSSTTVDGRNIRYVDGDVLDVTDWKALLRGVKTVVHLAAIVGDPACSLDHDLAWETNYLGTVRLAEACRKSGVERFVFASTCSNYGMSLGHEAQVDSPLCPQSVYAENKIHAEHYLLSVRDSRFSPCILRFATLYGLSPRMRFDLAVNVMTAKAVAEGKVTVFNGNQWRPFLHVRDAAQGIMCAIERRRDGIEPELFNCGTGSDNYRIVDVGGLIADEVGATVLIEDGGSDDRDYRVNFDRIRDDLGFVGDYQLLDGVREIKDALLGGSYRDYSDPQYSNFQLLVSRSKENKVGQSGQYAWPRVDFNPV